MNDTKTILVAVSDIFFYTKIRDAFLPSGYKLERIRNSKAGRKKPFKASQSASSSI